MVAKKRKSKRQTLQQKYKIQRRVKDHKKKLKRGSLSNPSHMRRKKKNDPDNRIPNAWPYKEDLLKEIRTAKERMEEIKQRQKEKKLQARASKKGSSMEEDEEDEDSDDDESEEGSDDGDEEMSASQDGEDSAEESVESDGARENGALVGQNSRRAYLSALRKVIEKADVVLHVLDVRDPLGTRSTAVEDMVLSKHRKKIVFVLNKADLVPKEVLQGWLAYFRQFHPTLAFKCNTQTQRGNLSQASCKVLKSYDLSSTTSGASLLHQTTHAIGAEELMSLLKNYCRSSGSGGGDRKSIITVGIVGFPNVGKSSLINSLTRTRAVGVSAMPGFTKTLQEVILDKNIRLIDSPGVVFADGNSATTVLRNCVNVDEMADLITPVQAILSKCSPEYLMQLYAIPRFSSNDANGFLALIARANGKLKKGGIPNIDAAAKVVLFDWNHGKIKYYCRPPPVTQNGDSSTAVASGDTGAKATSASLKSETQLLSSLSEELNWSDWAQMDNRVIDSLYDEKAVASDAPSSEMFIGVDFVAEKVDESDLMI